MPKFLKVEKGSDWEVRKDGGLRVFEKNLRGFKNFSKKLKKEVNLRGS